MDKKHRRPAAVRTALAVVVVAVVICIEACSTAAPPAIASGVPPEMESRKMAESLAPPSPAMAMMAGAPMPTPGASAVADGDYARTEAGGEEYKTTAENPFKQAAADAISTFAVDVDTASYANVRRFLAGGSLPPPDAVRIEELVNYFDYGWKEPSGGSPIAVTTEVASCPWEQDHRLLAIGLRTRSISADNLPPANLVFLIDSSGSMGSPDKLPLVKRAFSLLVETMRPQDKVAIAVYAGSAGLILPPTPGSDKATILAALEELGAGGSTAGGAGIVLAYETALQNFRKGGNNRVILATDGDFNVGLSSEAELTKLIESYRNKGVFLSVMGFGTGNVKDARMEALADKGNGNYGYVDSIAEARKLLVEEMGATLLTVAKDVKVQVEFDPAAVASWRLIGYENRLLAAEDFADDKKDAGEMGAGHRVTALYEIVPAGQGERKGGTPIGVARVRYKKPDADQSALLEFPVTDSGAAYAAASDDLRFAASVAAYGMLLRGSAHSGSADWALVRSLAKGASGTDASGRRAEFIALAEKAAALSK
jgi:Ca-activated chloride channel family protein